ncbi:C1 family peptidase [Leisingera caerulea]|uniref:hypothetical protein n=1 Tax=Leisingera caerulea TaxID=506591 RepID=UPI00041EF2BC|nr:hypothetical protein [Leisingera caerulea]
MPFVVPSEFIDNQGVRQDWVDLRDQPFVPSLSVLRDAVSIDRRLMEPIGETAFRRPIFGVRHQQLTQRCVGYALAALIDIQRNLQWLRRSDICEAQWSKKKAKARTDIASADMLYRMAYFHDRYPEIDSQQGGEEGIRSLRSAVKGFYHHGACLDWPESSATDDPGRWQSTCYFLRSPDNESYFPTDAQVKKAQETGLGAYFRLASVLNHYHSALNDAEAVLTTANVHDGWQNVTPDTGGVIKWPPEKGLSGCHAVVLTGYDDQGFHVLNSWGEDWGGYKGQMGIALWQYADWAQNVVDSWVLRLGVPAPRAFSVSTGEKGVKGIHAAARAGSTPCSSLAGHYMHLDDGFHVSNGSYPSFHSGWKRTRALLEERLEPKTRSGPAETLCKGVLLWIPGSAEGIKPAFDAAVLRKDRIEALGLYPYTIFWCNSFVETSMDVLRFIFDDAETQTGKGAEHLDRLIETRVRGIGRAIWREVETCAEKAVRGPAEHPGPRAAIRPLGLGYVSRFLRDLMQLKERTGCQLHLVAEGAGVMVLDEILAMVAEDGDGMFPHSKPADLFETLHLVHPAIGLPRAKHRLIPCIEAMNGELKGKTVHASSPEISGITPLIDTGAEPRARVYIPTPGLEEALHFGSYGKSLLHLVSRSFEDRHFEPQVKDGAPVTQGQPREVFGMSSLAGSDDFPPQSSIFRLNRVESPAGTGGKVAQTELMRDPAITDFIFTKIREMGEISGSSSNED